MLTLVSLTRRLFISAMSTLGVASASVVAQIETEDDGYGAAGYGEVPYGPTPDDSEDDTDDSDSDIGDPISSEPEPELTITEFSATEANPKNPHAEIEAEWTVEDTGGDLSDLMLRLEDVRGGLITRYGERLSGGSSTGTWEHRVHHGGSETYVLSILVETAGGRTATNSVTI